MDLSSDDDDECCNEFEGSYEAKPQKHISEIIQNKLYLGDFHGAGDLKTLKQLGITHIIHLGAPDEQMVYPLFDNFKHIRVVVDDVDNEPICNHFERTNGVIAHKDSVVFVHCWAGVSRSATIVAAYLIQHFGLSANEAIKYIQHRRQCVSPNLGFRKQLHSIAQTRKSPP